MCDHPNYYHNAGEKFRFGNKCHKEWFLSIGSVHLRVFQNQNEVEGKGKKQKAITMVELRASSIIDQLVVQSDFITFVVYAKGPESKTKKSVETNIATLALGMMIFFM